MLRTMSRLEEFLRSVPLLASLKPEHLALLAARSAEREFRAGEIILRTGERNRSLYLLESGRLAVEVPRGDLKDTVAHLHPGAPFGELSFITGRPCAADVRAVADATVVMITESTLTELPDARQRILELLALTIAERLHASVSQRVESPQTRVVLLHQYPSWGAPSAFAAELARSLARQTEWSVLRVDIRSTETSDPTPERERVSVATVSASNGPDAVYADLSARMPAWGQRFACILLNTTAEVAACAERLVPLASWRGHLLGPRDHRGTDMPAREFVVQDATGATLPRLSGREQLIGDVVASERAHASGETVSPRFLRTVDSMARCIAQLQVGLALGGGGAWAWSHIGVLRVLQRANIPIDVVSGCSMGSIVGALLATSRDNAALEQAARDWHRRFPTAIEFRFWRMHLARVSAVAGMLREHLGDRHVNQTDIPFWPNALDVEAAEEVALTDGDLVSALLASMSLPAWLPPTERGSRLLIDAAFVDPVPARLTRRMDCHFTIAVNAIGPFKARALKTRFPFRAYDFVSRCLRIVGHQLGQMQIESSADAVLVPDLPRDTSMLSFGRYADIIAAGEREAEARLPSILASYSALQRVNTAADAAAL
jgi:NTE family protein